LLAFLGTLALDLVYLGLAGRLGLGRLLRRGRTGGLSPLGALLLLVASLSALTIPALFDEAARPFTWVVVVIVAGVDLIDLAQQYRRRVRGLAPE